MEEFQEKITCLLKCTNNHQKNLKKSFFQNFNAIYVTGTKATGLNSAPVIPIYKK
jgi:hypothetical protein